ncbi:hypothetical protein MKX01_033951 [Papaver californicum]|nr:hypothetical protein MKX01_033951 [Papaver californicum]
MEAEISSKIKETVIEILKDADMDEMTEFKVRNIASQKLGGMDLSLPEPKQFVRDILESFLLSTEEEKPISVSETTTTTTTKTTAATVEEEPPLPSPLPEEIKTKEITEEHVVVEEEVMETKPEIGNKDIDDYGDVIICKLSEKRRITVQDFKGKTLVSIREYYQKDGKHFPSSKGISLSDEQWSAFRTAVPAIEEAIKTMELRLG